jgi:RNA polymerase-binding transcription factor DksA
MEAVHAAAEAAEVGDASISTVVAGDALDRESRLVILEQVEAELADIEHALRRLDDGTYGQCEACGDLITDDTLSRSPSTRFCDGHQAVADASERDQARS